MDFLTGFSKNRRAAYFAIALLIFVASFLLLPSAKAVNNVYYAALALPALCVLLWRGQELLRPSADLVLWGMLLVWFAVVGIWSADTQHYKHILYVALFLLVTSRLADPAPFRTPLFARGLFWTVAIYVMGSALFYWTTGRYDIGERVLWLPARMTGPIYTSLWLACCFALALPGWVRQRRWLEAATALALVVFCMGYILQSRSGLVALAVLLLLAPIIFRTGAKALMWGGMAMVMVSLATLLAISEIPEVASLFSRADAGRLQLWSIMSSEWMSCGLWIGCGMEHRTDQLLSTGQAINHPHSIFLSLGVFAGLPALLVFLALMGLVLRRAWRQRDPWGLYLLTALIGLNFDGTKLVGNPDELWLLVLLPAGLLCNAVPPAVKVMPEPLRSSVA